MTIHITTAQRTEWPDDTTHQLDRKPHLSRQPGRPELAAIRRRFRQDAGLSGIEAARQAGLSQPTVSRLETGHPPRSAPRRKPPPRTCRKAPPVPGSCSNGHGRCAERIGSAAVYATAALPLWASEYSMARLMSECYHREPYGRGPDGACLALVARLSRSAGGRRSWVSVSQVI